MSSKSSMHIFTVNFSFMNLDTHSKQGKGLLKVGHRRYVSVHKELSINRDILH